MAFAGVLVVGAAALGGLIFSRRRKLVSNWLSLIVFFEFKEFTALFTLPLSVAATFILWRYGRQILERNWTRTSVAILIALHFFYFMLAFGLGAAVTKLKSI